MKYIYVYNSDDKLRLIFPVLKQTIFYVPTNDECRVVFANGSCVCGAVFDISDSAYDTLATIEKFIRNTKKILKINEKSTKKVGKPKKVGSFSVNKDGTIDGWPGATVED